MSTTSTTVGRAAAGPVLKAGALTGLIAGVANLIVFFVGKAAGVPFEVKFGDQKQAIIFAQPILASLIGVFLGSVLLWLLSGFARGVTIWSVVAAVVVVLYSVLAFGAATSTSTGLLLTLMHLVAFAVAWVRLRPVVAG